MLYQAERSRGPDGSAFPDPMLAAQAKIFASETAITIVNNALQLFGARGYSRELPLERMARDLRMFTIGGGTAQVLRTLVASKMLGWKLPQTRDGYALTVSRANQFVAALPGKKGARIDSSVLLHEHVRKASLPSGSRLCPEPASGR